MLVWCEPRFAGRAVSLVFGNMIPLPDIQRIFVAFVAANAVYMVAEHV